MSTSQEIMEVLHEYETRLEELETEGITDRLRGETEAFEETTEALARIYAEEPDATPQLGPVANSISDLSNNINKSDAKEQITSLAQRKRAKQNGNERTPLDKWIRENLQEVRVTRTTDHINVTTYSWDFGGVTVETESGEESRAHYHWQNFRDHIEESGGPYLNDPNDPLTDMKEWRDFMVRQREQHETVKTYVGQRTMAVRKLQNAVEQRDAFESLEAVLNYGGVHAVLNEEPPDGTDPVNTDTAPQRLPEWRVDTLLVPNDMAKDAVEDTSATVRGLQVELDARGYTIEGQAGISVEKYVAGQRNRFWVVTGDFANPNQYQPEGEETTARDRDGEAMSDKQEIGGLGATDI